MGLRMRNPFVLSVDKDFLIDYLIRKMSNELLNFPSVSSGEVLNFPNEISWVFEEPEVEYVEEEEQLDLFKE
jgi:hypothetical protein